jgi:hypothetical protein
MSSLLHIILSASKGKFLEAKTVERRKPLSLKCVVKKILKNETKNIRDLVYITED